MGFFIGTIFSIYGFFLQSLFNKKDSKIFRKGIKHGAFLSFVLIFVFIITFFSFASYLQKINNQNLIFKQKKIRKVLTPMRFT